MNSKLLGTAAFASLTAFRQPGEQHARLAGAAPPRAAPTPRPRPSDPYAISSLHVLDCNLQTAQSVASFYRNLLLVVYGSLAGFGLVFRGQPRIASKLLKTSLLSALPMGYLVWKIDPVLLSMTLSPDMDSVTIRRGMLRFSEHSVKLSCLKTQRQTDDGTWVEAQDSSGKRCDFLLLQDSSYAWIEGRIENKRLMEAILRGEEAEVKKFKLRQAVPEPVRAPGWMPAFKTPF